MYRSGTTNWASSPRRALDEKILQVDVGVLRDELRRRLHVAVSHAIAFAHQRSQLGDGPLDPRLVGRRAVHDQIMPLRTDAHAEGRFELSEVFIVGAEEGLNTVFGNRDLTHQRRVALVTP